LASEITPVELAERLKQPNPPTVIDVREAHEREEASLPFTVWIPMNDIPERLDELDRQAEYVILCRVGIRSMRVADFLLENGFASATNLATGIVGWSQTVGPTPGA